MVVHRNSAPNPIYLSCVCAHYWLVALEVEMITDHIGHRAVRECCWLLAI